MNPFPNRLKIKNLYCEINILLRAKNRSSFRIATELTKRIPDRTKFVKVNIAKRPGIREAPQMISLLKVRNNSTWSTMTSLWNRIKPAAAKSLNDTTQNTQNNQNVQSNEPITPWTISSNLNVKRDPLTQFWIRTSLFRVSSQKLNLLGRQISRLPLPMAIAQMKFSPKKAAKEVHQLLLQAQARISQLPSKLNDSTPQINDPAKFIVQQALVGKGPYLKRIDIKGRGRHGVIWRPHSFLRLQVAIPDEVAALRKKFKVRIHKENKPVMTRLNY